MADDESMYEHYADPENRVPAGPGRRRASKPLSTHVPIRFRPQIVADVKQLADLDRKTVSSWIRDVVEAEVERRRPRIPRSVGTPPAMTSHWIGTVVGSTHTTVPDTTNAQEVGV